MQLLRITANLDMSTPVEMTKEEKQKARDLERAKKRQSPTPTETPEVPKP